MSLFADNRTLRGTLVKVWFRNVESGFAAGQFELNDGSERVAVCGTLAELAEGQPVALEGRFENHPRFGRRFVVERFEIERPAGADAVRAYLGSGFIKGIGPSLAARIVATLGETALDVIEEDEAQLLRVKGIGRKKAAEIRKAVRAQTSLRDVMLFLHGHGLSAGLAHRILDAYGEDAPRLLKNNPYRLADEMVGVGFRRADEVAHKIGVALDSEERKEAGLLHALQTAAQRDGHCCLPRARLLAAAGELLDLPAGSLEPALAVLEDTRRIVVQPIAGEPHVYPLTLFVAETGLATAIHRIASAAVRPLVADAGAAVRTWQRTAGFPLPDAQRQALELALRSPLCVITGGPGVGKTTIVRALAAIVVGTGRRLALAAPTGRAAKRLSEATDRPASTIHRLLEFQPGTNRFQRDERNPIEADLVVVDEASMLDLPLAYQLCRAVPPGSHLVFVGDVDQLPPVGPGRVLADLIGSGRVAVVRLTEIFRQRRGSHIVANAHRILAGQTPELITDVDGERSDFYFVEQRDADKALQTVLRLVTERIPAAFGLDPMNDVQVICPMYRGPLGVDRINEALGNALVAGGNELTHGARRFRVGDKVLQIKNNYDLDLFNGDPGRVTSIDSTARRLKVCFAQRTVDLSADELDQIVPAYGITVHRAQGSEYEAVILTLDSSHFLLLNRRLLYTAVTRARRLLVLVGSRWALERAVTNDEEGLRFTGLQERLDGRASDGEGLPRAASQGGDSGL